MVDPIQASATQFANIFGQISGNRSIDRLLEPYIMEIDPNRSKRDKIVYLFNTYQSDIAILRNIIQTIIDAHDQQKWIEKLEIINFNLKIFGLKIDHIEPMTNTVAILKNSDIDPLLESTTAKTNRRQIFISHSDKDEKIKGLFYKAFATSQLKAIYEEYEKLISGQVTIEKITHDINSSIAVFVLLSENVEKLHYTRDWVAFEAGYAYAKELDVWVFEPIDDFYYKQTFVTPGLTHYVPYIPGDEPVFVKLRMILDSYFEGKPIKSSYGVNSITCPKCHSKYIVHITPDTTFRCPVCNSKIFYSLAEGKITTKSYV